MSARKESARERGGGYISKGKGYGLKVEVVVEEVVEVVVEVVASVAVNIRIKCLKKYHD